MNIYLCILRFHFFLLISDGKFYVLFQLPKTRFNFPNFIKNVIYRVFDSIVISLNEFCGFETYWLLSKINDVHNVFESRLSKKLNTIIQLLDPGKAWVVFESFYLVRIRHFRLNQRLSIIFRLLFLIVDNANINFRNILIVFWRRWRVARKTPALHHELLLHHPIPLKST